MSSPSSSGQRAALTIGHLHVRRIEGIGEPFRIDALSSGINLIHGPNAIGKSRTAAALQAVIWPDTSSQRADLFGRLTISGEPWHVEIEGRQAQYARNGAMSTPPELSGTPSHHRDRYLLTLHDLLQADNADFAALIQREAAGGYDLAAIRREKRLATLPKANPRSRHKALNEAKLHVRNLRHDDEQLQKQERSLETLRSDLDDARQAASQVRLLERAREYVDAVATRDAARIAREAFEDPIGRMAGDEHERAQQLDAELAEAIQQRQQVQFEFDQAIRELDATGFAQGLPSETVLPELRRRLSRLRDRESDIRQTNEEIAKHRAELGLLRERIGANLTDAQIASMDRDGLRALAELTRAYDRAAAHEGAQDSLYSWLRTTDPPTDLEPLRRGAELLARYLRIGGLDADGTPSARTTRALLGAAVLIFIEAIVLAVAVSPFFIVLALAAVLIALLAFRKEDSPARAQAQAEAVQHEYARLGLEMPSGWSPEAVEPLLDRLQTSLADARLEQQKAMRWMDLAEDRQRATEDRQRLQERRQTMLVEFGVAPEKASAETCELIAQALDRWRHAGEALARWEASAEEARQQRASVLADINSMLVSQGGSKAVDDIEAEAAIEHLGRREHRAQQAVQKRDDRRQMLDGQIQTSIARLQTEMDAIYDAAGIESGEHAALRERCAQVKPCREAQRVLDDAETAVRIALDRIRDSPEYLTKTREEIEHELARATELAGKNTGIQKEISDIEAEIRQAKGQTQLEEASAAEARALDELHESRTRDCEQIAGWSVLEFVQQRSRDQNRPAVFRRANELMVDFTSGAYELELNDSNPPEFVARETASRTILPLDTLSSGTRVQLLMAVRLAFIETAEQGPQLPLILDETLGNTDDVRANAIIDAAIEISRAGRQVIYFTAQHDEIAKWQGRMRERADAPACETFDLASIRGESAAERTAQWQQNRSVAVFDPVPDGLDYDGARSHFNVAPVDLWADHIDGVDLWYVIPDVAALATLRHREISQWGPYQVMYRRDELKGAACPALHERATARALVIETVRRNWQVGRARPFTRACLRDSGMITERFFDAVAALLDEVEWCGASLVQALRSGGVSGFRKDAMDRLEEHCRDHGFITDAQPRPDHEIRAVVLSEAHQAIEQGVISGDEVDALLMSLTAEPVTELAYAD